MYQGIAEITLIYMLPLGISFVTIFATATCTARNTKIIGGILSTLTIVTDCLFFFVKNTFITTNVEDGILLSFFLLFLFGLFCLIQSNEWSSRASFLLFSMCMLIGGIGNACIERPTQPYTSSIFSNDFASHDKKYEDYLSSFYNANDENIEQGPSSIEEDYGRETAKANDFDNEIELPPEVMDRLDAYVDKAKSAIEKMYDIMHSINSFEPMEPNASDMEREKRSQQALAINNKATSLNRKTIGIFHPMETREAHSELVHASETIRSAAHALYSYCLLEDQQEAMRKYSQAHELIGIAQKRIDNFKRNIENLKTNNQPQQ